MQKPVKRGNSYRIQVKYKHLRDAATRDTAKECTDWAVRRLMELQLQYQEELKKLEKPDIPFRDLFTQYYENVGKNKKSSPYIKNYLKQLDYYLGHLANTSIYDITPQDMVAVRDRRLKLAKSSTVNRELSLCSSVFTYAVSELFILKENPVQVIKKPSLPPPRNQRITDEHIDLILKGLDNYNETVIPNSPAHEVAWAFLFALETTMRRGEIIGIRDVDDFGDYVHLPDTKNGTSRNVPLTTRGRKLLDLLKGRKGQLLKHNSNSFRLIWQRNLAKVGLNGVITFHDTRHEAITRLVNIQKIPVEILAKITGHRTINILVNTYYNPSASEIAKMLNAA
ncbi:hypothetical protein F900_01850 [Acinetobacter modestus]|uniref:Tyr recombinase domain-containing protein n=1 Tax=Acinetobacter modestus TaxID=1776740 RepID=N9N5F5_9GAMM|nr:site-specific integrase [Acinetobacter modestus]ENX00866.1 hypothetical protein F900_01850 [Acinetobacter modestus]